MPLSIELPEDIRFALESHWGDLCLHVRETMAVDGYRQGFLTLAQVRRMLNLDSRSEAQEFLSRHGIAAFDLDPSELDREAALQERILNLRQPE